MVYNMALSLSIKNSFRYKLHNILCTTASAQAWKIISLKMKILISHNIVEDLCDHNVGSNFKILN